MNANFYIHPDTMRYDNSVLSDDEYKRQFKRFVSDLTDILKAKETFISDSNTVIISSEMYTEKIYHDMNIWQFVYEDDNRDIINFVQLILGNQAESKDFSVEEIEKLSSYNPEETECHTMTVINRLTAPYPKNKYIQFDKYDLVYNKDSWLRVRRQILGNHPMSPAEFIERCRVYFPAIEFADYCVDSLSDHLEKSPRRIVYYLSCMNDFLCDYIGMHPTPQALNDVWGEFAGRHGFDKAGSQQGKPKAGNYTFDFNDGKQRCCGAHFKIQRCDDNYAGGDAGKYRARIYFAIDEGMLYVGSIGNHL